MPRQESSEKHDDTGKSMPEDALNAHNNLLADSLGFIEKNKVNIAAGAALTLGTIVLLKGKALTAAPKEIAAVTKAAEEGLTGTAAKNADGFLASIIDDIKAAGQLFDNKVSAHVAPEALKTKANPFGYSEEWIRVMGPGKVQNRYISQLQTDNAFYRSALVEPGPISDPKSLMKFLELKPKRIDVNSLTFPPKPWL